MGQQTLKQIWSGPDVYRLPPPEVGPDSRNCYLVAAQGQVLAVDPPLRTAAGGRALEAGLAALDCRAGQARLFFTHLHSGWAGLRTELIPPGTPAYLGRGDCRSADPAQQWTYQRRWYRREGFPKAELKRYAGEENAGCGLSEENVHPMSSSQTLAVGPWAFRCLPLPGHTPGHTALFLPEQRLFFSGDLLLFDRIPYVGVWKGQPHALEDYLESLNRLRELSPEVVFPAHGRWDGPTDNRMEELICHAYMRILELYQLVRNHPGLTAYGLAARFRWKQKPWDSLPPKQRWFAMGETLSHLTYLRDRNYVETRLGEEGLVNLPGKRRLTDA